MDHNDIRHKLSEFIDGAITPGEKADIEQHLKTCTECSEALRELRKTIEHIHAVEQVDSPAWMTQKIMTKVREEAEEKKGLWQRVFAPFFTLFPVQAVAVLFLSVTVFYIYTTMHPAEKYAEAPIERIAKQEAHEQSRDALKQKAPEITERREKKVAQGPDYKSLDMKYEYEKPAPPMPLEQPAASAPAPAKREAKMYAQDKTDLEKRSASPRAESVAPSLMAKQAAPSAGAQDHEEAIRPARAPLGLSNVAADRNAKHEPAKSEKTVVQQHPNGKPMVIVTEKITASGKLVIMRERFDENGKRHGIQEEYYDSGKLKANVEYDHGKLFWYMEFEENGTKKLEKSKKDWLWLKQD
jgi:hypothetical protein